LKLHSCPRHLKLAIGLQKKLVRKISSGTAKYFGPT
jgi:hypothetical protein